MIRCAHQYCAGMYGKIRVDRLNQLSVQIDGNGRSLSAGYFDLLATGGAHNRKTGKAARREEGEQRIDTPAREFFDGYDIEQTIVYLCVGSYPHSAADIVTVGDGKQGYGPIAGLILRLHRYVYRLELSSGAQHAHQIGELAFKFGLVPFGGNERGGIQAQAGNIQKEVFVHLAQIQGEGAAFKLRKKSIERLFGKPHGAPKVVAGADWQQKQGNTGIWAHPIDDFEQSAIAAGTNNSGGGLL